MREPLPDPSGLEGVGALYPALTRTFYQALRILLVFGGIGVAASFYRMVTQPGWRAAFAGVSRPGGRRAPISKIAEYALIGLAAVLAYGPIVAGLVDIVRAFAQ